MIKSWVVSSIIFLSVPTFAQQSIYAEDIMSDLEKNQAMYTMSIDWPAYINKDLQDEANCYIGARTDIRATTVEAALPINFLVWNNHIFYVRNTVIDRYFENDSFKHKLSKKTDSITLGIFFRDLVDSNFEETVAHNLAILKDQIQSNKQQLNSLKELKIAHQASEEVLAHMPKVAMEIERQETMYKKHFSLYVKFKYILTFFTNASENSKRGQRKKENFENRYAELNDDLDRYFVVFPEKKASAADFLNDLFSDSTLQTIHSYPFEFKVLKNIGYTSGHCSEGFEFWGIVMSKEIAKYGRTSSLVRSGISN